MNGNQLYDQGCLILQIKLFFGLLLLLSLNTPTLPSQPSSTSLSYMKFRKSPKFTLSTFLFLLILHYTTYFLFVLMLFTFFFNFFSTPPICCFSMLHLFFPSSASSGKVVLLCSFLISFDLFFETDPYYPLSFWIGSLISSFYHSLSYFFLSSNLLDLHSSLALPDFS